MIYLFKSHELFENMNTRLVGFWGQMVQNKSSKLKCKYKYESMILAGTYGITYVLFKIKTRTYFFIHMHIH